MNDLDNFLLFKFCPVLAQLYIVQNSDPYISILMRPCITKPTKIAFTGFVWRLKIGETGQPSQSLVSHIF